MADAFISYRRDPSSSQARLVQEMLKFYHKIDAYVDTTRTDSTRVQFPDRLMQAIADSPTFILLLGDTTLKSEWVRKEIQQAYDLKKHCIPIFQESYKPIDINDSAIEYVLNFEGVKLFDRQNVYIDEAINQIANYVLKSAEIQNQPIITPQITFPPKPKITLPQPFDWCYIPAGKVTLMPDAIDNNIYIKQNLTVDISSFWIAKYPVTNAQYREFILDKGYPIDNFWTQSGINARNRNGWTKPRYWNDSKWNQLDYPVIGISWYEAIAFCNWLSRRSGDNIMLPSDAMWQRAAQGNDERQYTWGNEWESNFCNNSVGGKITDKTTPVRQYEGKGDSPFGVVDMVGNVWDICSTEYVKGGNNIDGSESHIIKGGSWNHIDKHKFRSTYCEQLIVDWENHRNEFIGFRIACQIDPK